MTRFLTPRQVADRLGYAHPGSIKRLSRQGRLPPMIKVGPNRSVFVEEEIEAVAQSLIASRDAKLTKDTKE